MLDLDSGCRMCRVLASKRHFTGPKHPTQATSPGCCIRAIGAIAVVGAWLHTADVSCKAKASTALCVYLCDIL